MATRSAQVPTGYDAFSTLAPTITWAAEGAVGFEVLSKRDAPTRKSEYGPSPDISTQHFYMSSYRAFHTHEHSIASSMTKSLTISSLARIKALLAQNLQFLRRDTVDQAIFLFDGFSGTEFRYLGRGHGGEEKGRERRRGDASRWVLLMRAACMTWGRGTRGSWLASYSC